MISACLNGQTGPHKDYPGFGGQGSALGGYNALTGWPDREPVGPYGTITDSLAPRFVAAALAAGLLYRRRTGKGVYLDISQVESANWSLSPWLLDYEIDGVIRLRDGNRHAHDVPARRVPVRRRRRRRRPLGRDRVLVGRASGTALARAHRRRRRLRHRVARSTQGTRRRDRGAACRRGPRRAPAPKSPSSSRPPGSRRCPVEDFGDLHDDPQLALREHFEPHTHAFLGPGLYERNGFRLSDAPSGYDQAGPDARPGHATGSCATCSAAPTPRSRR